MLKEITKNGVLYVIEETFSDHPFYRKFTVYKLNNDKLNFYKKYIAIDINDVIKDL